MFTQDAPPYACFACVRLGDPDPAGARERWWLAVRICRQLTPLIEEYPRRRALFLALSGSERLLLGGARATGGGGDDELPGATDTPDTLWPLLSAALARRFADAGLAGLNIQTGGHEQSGNSGVRLAAGIGPTRTLAWLVARTAMRRQSPAVAVALPGEEPAFLAPLPVALLQQAPDAVEIMEISALTAILAALEEAGVHTLGQLRRLPADALVRRFGREGGQLAILAAGGDLRPFRPQVAESWLGARLVFDPSRAAEQLKLALGPLAEKLALTLARRELAAGKLALALESETGAWVRAERRLAHSLGTTRALLDVAERLLAGSLTPVLAAPDAPDVELPAAEERYVTLRLRVGGLHPATAKQRRLWAGEQRAAGAERVERLATALRAPQGGRYADTLLWAELHEPDAALPEERYRLTPRA